RTLVADCLDQLSPLADAQRIAMHNAVPEPLWVMIDPHQFRRVLNNLIGNSLDNIGEGDAITVSAGLAEEGRFWLRVADTGPGVEPEWLPHLF
ncbi:ATP-binding protein, partial [Salmonella enterica]|uniref:ATP-binding protein n=1 Tax=Salmonella enterica TaxID=28901 RepID=UPI003D2D93D9